MVREAVGNGEFDREAVVAAVQVIMMDAFRASLKEIVKEAVREVREEPTDSGGGGVGRSILYLGFGVAIGYLAASGRLPMMGGNRAGEQAIEIDRGDEESIASED